MEQRSEAFIEEAGFNAFRLGITSFDAPYKPGTKELKSWLAGYSRAKRQHASAMEVSEKNKPKATAIAPSGTTRLYTRPRAQRGTTDRQNRNAAARVN